MSESTTETTPEPTTTKRSSKFNHQNFETQVGRSDFLLTVLTAEPPENLARYGITPEAITAFGDTLTKVKSTDQKQEEAKATLKTITATLVIEQKTMKSQYSTFKRKIKAETPMQEWKRFGFSDKQ